VPHEDGRKRLNYTTCDRMQKYNIVNIFMRGFETDRKETTEFWFCTAALKKMKL
jgi:hypothetical protein